MQKVKKVAEQSACHEALKVMGYLKPNDVFIDKPSAPVPGSKRKG